MIQNQSNQLTVTHERQHLKKMLIKFIELLCKTDQTKEALDILKIICSLVDCSDKERNELIILLAKKDEKKKTGVLKMFGLSDK